MLRTEYNVWAHCTNFLAEFNVTKAIQVFLLLSRSYIWVNVTSEIVSWVNDLWNGLYVAGCSDLTLHTA